MATSLVKCGLLNPWCPVGRGVITEHVVFSVLNDCLKCNTYDNFNAAYDLISDKYGKINVKSSKLSYKSHNSYKWQFNVKEHQFIPDYYVCLGFDQNYTNIIKVWLIPGTANIVNMHGIYITNSEVGLDRAISYEIEAKPYDDVYKTFNILDLPEFVNLYLWL